MLTILLIILIVLAFGGNFGYYGTGYAPYTNIGNGFGAILIVVLIVLLVRGV